MENEDLIRTVVNAIVVAVVTSEAFKATVDGIIDGRIKEFNAEDGDLLESNEFKQAVEDIIDDHASKIDDERIKEVVRGMDFTVEVGRY